MSEIRTVLIGTALDESSGEVVRAGVEVARATGAKACLAHAFGPPIGVGSSLWPMLGSDEYLRGEEDRLRAALEEQAKRAGLDGEWSLENGPSHRALSDLAERMDADLLVVGHRADGRMTHLLGSTAERVVRKAHCPVLVVRGGLTIPPQRVVAPVDLSPLSGEAFQQGIQVLRAMGKGSLPEIEALFVLSVLQRQVAPQFTPEQIDRFALEELGRFVELTAGELAGSVRRKVRTGNTREEIEAELAEAGADLVVLGTHGLGGFDRMVIGSVAADVVRHAPCSVLVVPPRATRGGRAAQS
ncbi:MAG TPA: universal stress protein [Thermoanaerobaculia bacterium]|nr:universal stress protein [Thermoanaerobaculia bacterium]